MKETIIDYSKADYDTSRFVSNLMDKILSKDWKENLIAEYHESI